MIIRFFLALSSFSSILLFFIISKKVDIPCISVKILGEYEFFQSNIIFWKYFFVSVIVLFFAYICILILRFCFRNKKHENIEIIEIKPMEFTLMPIYISIFVIALELDDNGFEIENKFLLIILFLFWFYLEKTSYFNPLWLFFGFRFYEVKTSNNVVLMFITRDKDLKGKISKNELIKLNNFTFLELK